MKIVWVCYFSNKEVYKKIRVKLDPFMALVYRLRNKTFGKGEQEWEMWHTNAINEMKEFSDIELHIITAYPHLSNKRQEFSIDGVKYHFVKDVNSTFIPGMIRHIFHSEYTRSNSKRIISIIREIKPDLVHFLGAENLPVSLALLDIPKDIPCIVQLQTLLSSMDGKVTGKIAKNYAYRAKYEKLIIQRADFVGTCVPEYIKFIRNQIKHDAIIVNTTLAMGRQIVQVQEKKKKYTFVHFARTLGPHKATDIAIKAFAIVHDLFPNATLDIIGGCNGETKESLINQINEYGIQDYVIFEGAAHTHEDVITKICESQFALLPLKIDILPNTIHEAMTYGLPVLTTKTPGTPALNSKRQSVLISEIGDYHDLANNMIELLNNPDLAERIKQNALITETERIDNHQIIEHWKELYQAILDKQKYGKELPKEYIW